MAITTKHPVKRNGKTYDLLGVSLALSQMWKPNGVGVSIAVRLTPYRNSDVGPERLDDEARAVVYGDATQDAQTDPVLAAFLQAIEAAGQTFIDAKGL
jgi:hypothetical protein